MELFSGGAADAIAKGSFHCFYKIMNKEGMKAMYKGMTPELFRGVGGSLVIVAYDCIKLIFGILAKIFSADNSVPPFVSCAAQVADVGRKVLEVSRTACWRAGQRQQFRTFRIRFFRQATAFLTHLS